MSKLTNNILLVHQLHFVRAFAIHLFAISVLNHRTLFKETPYRLLTRAHKIQKGILSLPASHKGISLAETR